MTQEQVSRPFCPIHTNSAGKALRTARESPLTLLVCIRAEWSDDRGQSGKESGQDARATPV